MLLAAVLFNAVTGALFAAAAGFTPGIGAVGMNAVGVLMGMYGDVTPVLRAGVYTEIWTGELVKVLRSGLAGSWLDGVPDQSSIVNNDVIHLVEVGVDPDVLINNTTYPIPMQALEDKDIAISLDKFQSKVTPITDDELYAISYDKMARVKESHGNAINDAKFAKAAHALCATEHTAKTPVLKTSGDADEETGRKRLTPNDLVEMKRALDKLKVPSENRRLVLCPDHVNDLLLVSQNFREQYNIDRGTGKVGNLYGRHRGVPVLVRLLYSACVQGHGKHEDVLQRGAERPRVPAQQDQLPPLLHLHVQESGCRRGDDERIRRDHPVRRR